MIEYLKVFWEQALVQEPNLRLLVACSEHNHIAVELTILSDVIQGMYISTYLFDFTWVSRLAVPSTHVDTHSVLRESLGVASNVVTSPGPYVIQEIIVHDLRVPMRNLCNIDKHRLRRTGVPSKSPSAAGTKSINP